MVKSDEIMSNAVESGFDAMEAFEQAVRSGDTQKAEVALNELKIAQDIYFSERH